MPGPPPPAPERSPDGTAATVVAAARSIAQSSDRPSVDEVVKARAIDCYAEGLRQYLALRLGEAPASSALVALRRRVEALEAADVVAPPGVRARLFRIARELARDQAEAPGTAGTVKWRKPRRPVTQTYTAALSKVRAGVLGAEGELLELRHARGLTPDEVAFVVEGSADTMPARLESAAARARELFGAVHDEGLPEALLEAFALAPDEGNAPDPDAELVIPEGTIIGGRYRVERLLGSGGFANVFQATDTEVDGHVVALKLLHRPAGSEEAKAQALRELHIIASVFHPSIVQFKDHGWHEARFWFVMPWYEGETLEARLARGALSRQEAKRIFVPLARALATMHAGGIRHQDVKPDNILLARIKGVGGDGEDVLPVLLDLGVAAKEAELLLAGTPTYFAPEVAAMFAEVSTDYDVSNAADVFSLALSLRNALDPDTQPDVPAGAVDHFIDRRAHSTPEPPQTKGLKYLGPSFKRWMHLEPTERPSADEFADELAVLTAPEERRDRRRRVLRVVVPMLITLAVLFSTVAWELSKRADAGEKLAEEQRLRAAGAEADLAGAEADLEEAASDLQARMANAREQIESEQLSKEQLESELVKTRAELGVAQQHLTQTQRRVRALGEQITQGEAQATTLTASVASQRRRADELSARVRVVEGELAGARARRTQLESRVQALTTQEATLRSQASAAGTRAAAAERELASSRGALTAAQGAQRTAERALATAQARIRTLETQLAQARARRPAPRPAIPRADTTANTGATTMATAMGSSMASPVRVRLGN